MSSSLVKRYFSILFSGFGAFLIGLAITPILVRLLGSGDYGDYSFLLSLLQILMIIAGAGIFDGVRKYLTEDRKGTIPDWKNTVFGFYARVSLTATITVATLLSLLTYTGVTSIFLDPYMTDYLYILALVIITRGFFSLVRSTLMGLELEVYGEPLNAVKKLILGVVGLSLVYLGLGVTGILIGHLIATLLVGVIGSYFLLNNIKFGAVLGKSPSNFPKFELLSFNGFSAGLVLLAGSLYHTDILLLQPLAGSEETGLYRAALVIAHLLWFVPNTLGRILLHSTSKMWSENDIERVNTLSSRLIRFTLLFTVLLVIGLIALADPFMPMYFGSEFRASITPLLLLLPGVLAFAIAKPIIAIGQGKGDVRILLVATGSASIINVLLNIILIPDFGMIGAAIATSIGYGSMLVFHGISAYKIGFEPFRDLRIQSLAGTVLISCPVIFGLSLIITSDVISIVVVPIAGLFVYSIAALKFRSVSPKELRPILEALPDPLNDYSARILDMLS